MTRMHIAVAALAVSVGFLTACKPETQQRPAETSLEAPPLWQNDFDEQHTPAFREAVRLHASTIATLQAPHSAGLWVVQDPDGRLISSGVLEEFPNAIGSGDYGTVVPGAAGMEAESFGFARTERIAGNGPFRVAYVTVSS